MTDRRELESNLQLVMMAYKAFIFLDPCLVEACMFQYRRILTSLLSLVIHQGTTHQILQIFNTETELNTLFQTPAMAIVSKTIIIVHAIARHLHHTDRHRWVTQLRTVLVTIHLVTLTSQTEEGQITHHDDGTCRFFFVTDLLSQHTLPVKFFQTFLHTEFLMEVMVLKPEAVNAIACSYNNDQMNAQPTEDTRYLQLLPSSIFLLPFSTFLLSSSFFHHPPSCFHLLFPPSSVHQCHKGQWGHQEIIRNIIVGQFLVDDVQRESSPPDMLNAGLAEYVIIVEQGPEGNRNNSNNRTDDATIHRQPL